MIVDKIFSLNKTILFTKRLTNTKYKYRINILFANSLNQSIYKNYFNLYLNCFYTSKTRSTLLYQNDNIESVKLKTKLNVVFFGTDLLSIKILTGLNKLHDDKIINDLNVVTSAHLITKKNDNNYNNKTSSNSNLKQHQELVNFHGSQIINYCNENKIKYHIWSDIKDYSKLSYENLFKSFNVGLVASFGHLIPSKLIEIFPFGIINIHPSLLPRWRGASPIIYSILFNDKQVGVSIMKILPKHFDIGPLLSQKSIPAPMNISSFKLLDHLGNIGNEMIMDLFKNFDTNIKNLCEQSNENVCYDWQDSTMSDIDCQYRALHEIRHLKTKLDGEVLKLFDMAKLNEINLNEMIPKSELDEPGTIKFIKKKNLIVVKCKDGFVGFSGIILRKKLTAQAFYNGYLNNKGLRKFDSIPNTIKQNIFIRKV